MKISPKIPLQNHNVSKESDSALFFRYVGFFLAIFVSLYVFLFLCSYVATYFITIDEEQDFFNFGDTIFSPSPLPEVLAERYADIEYNLSLIDMDGEENAFASLGGNMYITQELLDTMSYYEELDFIVGHEVSHIAHRDVIRSLVSSVPITLFLSLFGGDYGGILFGGVVGNNHSKFIESRSDRDGLDYVYAKNGHVGCALDFFEKGNTLGGNILEIFSTHPMTSLRIYRAKRYIERQGYSFGDCTPLELGNK